MDLIQILNFVLLFSSCLVAGAAFYVSVVENPARNNGMIPQIRLKSFIPTYKKAAVSQATSLITSIIVSGALYFLTWNLLWVIGCGLLLFVLIFTLTKILPLNNILTDETQTYTDVKITELLNKWTRLQVVRTFCCIIAFLIFVYITIVI